MDDPEYIVLVALDTPSRSTGLYISGGVMAAPTVGAVMSDILPYLGVAHNYSDTDPVAQTVIMPDLRDLTTKEAQKQLKELGLTMKTVGTGEIITSQIPAPGQSVPGGSEVLAYFGECAEPEMVSVPDFSGMTRQQASDAAGALGIYILVSGNPSVEQTVIVTAQSIAPGTKVPVGTTIQLEFIDTQVSD
jgi:stage V sporulation protein D (sporulation-specific penicillin-binding protein)